MNLPTAQGILQTLIKSKQDDADALTLALSILNTTFAPDLQAIADAQKDADEQRTLVADLTAQVEALTPRDVPVDDAQADEAAPVDGDQ